MQLQAEHSQQHSSAHTGQDTATAAGLTISKLTTLVEQQLVTLPGAKFAASVKEAAKDRVQPLGTLARLRDISRKDTGSAQVSELLPHVGLLIQQWNTDRKAATARKNLVKLAWLLSLPEVRAQVRSTQQYEQIRSTVHAAKASALAAATAAAASKKPDVVVPHLLAVMQAAKQDAAAIKTAGAKRKAADKLILPAGKQHRTAGAPTARQADPGELCLQPLPGASPTLAYNPSTLLWPALPCSAQRGATSAPSLGYASTAAVAPSMAYVPAAASADGENIGPPAHMGLAAGVSTHPYLPASASIVTGIAPCKPVDPRIRWMQKRQLLKQKKQQMQAEQQQQVQAHLHVQEVVQSQKQTSTRNSAVSVLQLQAPRGAAAAVLAGAAPASTSGGMVASVNQTCYRGADAYASIPPVLRGAGRRHLQALPAQHAQLLQDRLQCMKMLMAGHAKQHTDVCIGLYL